MKVLPAAVCATCLATPHVVAQAASRSACSSTIRDPTPTGFHCEATGSLKSPTTEVVNGDATTGEGCQAICLANPSVCVSYTYNDTAVSCTMSRRTLNSQGFSRRRGRGGSSNGRGGGVIYSNRHCYRRTTCTYPDSTCDFRTNGAQPARLQITNSNTELDGAWVVLSAVRVDEYEMRLTYTREESTVFSIFYAGADTYGRWTATVTGANDEQFEVEAISYGPEERLLFRRRGQPLQFDDAYLTCGANGGNGAGGNADDPGAGFLGCSRDGESPPQFGLKFTGPAYVSDTAIYYVQRTALNTELPLGLAVILENPETACNAAG